MSNSTVEQGTPPSDPPNEPAPPKKGGIPTAVALGIILVVLAVVAVVYLQLSKEPPAQVLSPKKGEVLPEKKGGPAPFKFGKGKVPPNVKTPSAAATPDGQAGQATTG